METLIVHVSPLEVAVALGLLNALVLASESERRKDEKEAELEPAGSREES